MSESSVGGIETTWTVVGSCVYAHVAMLGELGFGLELEEGVMQDLVVNVDLAHLGL